MALKWFQLVDAAGAALADVDGVHIDTPMVLMLRDAVKAKYADSSHLVGIVAANLIVFANHSGFRAKQALLSDAKIKTFGTTRASPLIIQVPPSKIPTMKRKWFQLVGAFGEALANVDYVSIDTAVAATLRKAVKAEYVDSLLAGIAPSKLAVYANCGAMEAKTPLDEDVSIESIGNSRQDPLIVQVSPDLPPLIPLGNEDLFTNECGSLTTWEVGIAHDVPLIYTFMEALGGCTTNGKIFWRLEEQQLAALLLNGWFPETCSEKINPFPGKSSIVLGSPGVGKSTLLCLLAFYAVIVLKKNLLLYRQLLTGGSRKALLYLGWEHDRIVYFSLPDCRSRKVAEIRNSMGPSVALWLDGFVYDKIPEGLGQYAVLATSQQANLKSQDEEYAYRCLLPCWRQNDLFALGREVFGYEYDEMVKRFYYSGGSVRDFAAPTAEDTEDSIGAVVSHVKDPEKLLSSTGLVLSGGGQVDRLRHTFLKVDVDGDVDPHSLFLRRKYWEQVVDSEYALASVGALMRSDALYRIYHWARRSGYASLAGCVFEAYTHRLAGDNMLKLFVSEYRKCDESSEEGRYPHHFQPLPLQSGRAERSGTKNAYVDALTKWRDTKKVYWYPLSQDFPNIDSIVKVAPKDTASDRSMAPPTTIPISAEKCAVAYLQITVAATHSIDGKHLEEMNKIFKAAVPMTTGTAAMAGKTAVPMGTTGSAPSESASQAAAEDDRPMYVAVCPDRASCDKLDLTTAADVLDARRVCRVYVGYYEHVDYAINVGGWDVPSLKRPEPPRQSSRLQSLEKKRHVGDETRG